MNRGNRKALIFEDDRDRLRFLRLLEDASVEHRVVILLVCLMGNHFHLVVRTPNGNISEFMEKLEGSFAQYSNWRHQRVGHLFQDRYIGILIENDVHLLTAACYVVMNPVAAGFVTRLEAWKWSSYAATIGIAPVPVYLTLDWLDTLFPCGSRRESQEQFRHLLNQDRPVTAYLRGVEQDVSPESVRRVIQSYIGNQIYRGPIPREYRSALRPLLGQVFLPGISLTERNACIQDAHLLYGYTLTEIAKAIGLHPASVSRLFRKGRQKR
jgi:putative transposase